MSAETPRNGVLDLADAVCNETAAEPDFARLSAPLRDDLANVQAYVEHLDLHAELYGAADRHSVEEIVDGVFGRAPDADDVLQETLLKLYKWFQNPLR